MSQQEIVNRIVAARAARDNNPASDNVDTQDNVDTPTEDSVLPSDSDTDESNTDALDTEVGPLESLTEGSDEDSHDDDDEDPLDDDTEVDEDAELVESDDSDDDLYFELDGEDVTLAEVREWKKGNLRHSDYTRKTQELANQRKELATYKEDIANKQKEIDKLYAQLTFLVDEDKDIDMEELKEEDPYEFIRISERQKAMQEAINKYSRVKEPTKEEAQAELTKLLSMNPDWVKDNAYTDSYKKDMALVDAYFKKYGYTPEEQKITSARQWQTVILAARAEDNTVKKKQIATKKVRKVPISSKPGRKAPPSALDAELKAAEERHKREGSEKSALALRKARRAVAGNK